MARKTNVSIKGYNYYQSRVVVGHVGGKPIYKKFYGKSKKESLRKRDLFLAGIGASKKGGTFGTAFASWLEEVKKPSIGIASYKNYTFVHRLYIKDSLLTNLLVNEIKSPNIQHYYNYLLNTHGSNTVRNVHKLLSAFFIYCVKADILTKSPLLAVTLPADKGVSSETQTFNAGEIKKIIQAAKDNDKYFIYVFALFTGMREGEILALSLGDIRDNAIHINKTVKYLNQDGVFSPLVTSPKTKGSNRQVPINEYLKPMLERHIQRVEGQANNDKRLLFPTDTGTYKDGCNTRKGLERLLKRLEISPRPRVFHTLRHTFITLLIIQGVPLKVVSDLAGHSDIHITSNIYTHITAAAKKEGITSLNNLFIEN
jgi:integrase